MNKRKPWQRLALSILGIIILTAVWWVAIQHLYTLKVEAYASFTTLTGYFILGVTSIIGIMITGKAIVDMKMDAAINTVEQGMQMIEKRVPGSKHFDSDDIP